MAGSHRLADLLEKSYSSPVGRLPLPGRVAEWNMWSDIIESL